MRSASDPGVGELRMTHHCWPSDHTFEVVQYRSTPMGKDTPEMTNTPGSRYIRSFCWRAIGLSAAEAGMFFKIRRASCRERGGGLAAGAAGRRGAGTGGPAWELRAE